MKSSLPVRVFLTWLLFVPLAILNGMIRENVYKPIVGELRAHQISTAIASGAFFSLVFSMLKNKVAQLDNTKLLLIGGALVSMTILFEVGFGHYLNKVSWQRLVNDYNLLKGRVWSLFLMTELVSPLLVKFMKNFRQGL